MSKYVVAFHSDSSGTSQKVLEASSEEEVVKFYFENYVQDYSKDSEGFSCFKEDFYDEENPLGSILEI